MAILQMARINRWAKILDHYTGASWQDYLVMVGNIAYPCYKFGESNRVLLLPGRTIPRVSTREHNERKFPTWKELASGGRRYWLDVLGRHGWKARYVKEVDVTEVTVRFYQEIYNDQGTLVEVHEKYPNDHGHQKVEP